MEKAISVIGLGKLGAPLAACVAAKGLRVIGVDIDPAKVRAINEGRAPVFEPDLEHMIQAGSGRISATADAEEAVRASDITFIVVATPTEPGGGFSLRFAFPVCESIGRALRKKQSFHLVVLVSTVMPGATGGPVRAALEEASGKRCGYDFGLCYGPEFIALGSAIHDFLNPDFILIGESDSRAGDWLEELYHRVCDNKPPISRMNLVNAEIAKLAVNTYITSKISFANMLARICEKLPEANVDVVTSAIGLDTRIGGRYLTGAISYGGPCFPRDNHALAALANQVGAPGTLARETDRFNRAQVHWLADLVQRCARDGDAVGVLGFTYKANTDVIEEAVGVLLAQELAGRGLRVVAYDPAGNQNLMPLAGGRVTVATSAQACIEEADVVVVATAWKEFAEIPAQEWARKGEPRTVVDCWRVLKHLDSVEGVRYLRLGIGVAAAVTHSVAS